MLVCFFFFMVNGIEGSWGHRQIAVSAVCHFNDIWKYVLTDLFSFWTEIYDIDAYEIDRISIATFEAKKQSTGW